MNVPVRLGKNGVEEVVEFDLNDDELTALRASRQRARGIGEPAGVVDLRDGEGAAQNFPHAQHCCRTDSSCPCRLRGSA
ncbi:MAG: hypothetical protein ACLSVD_08560 [Eggerthellaceae bacterium]